MFMTMTFSENQTTTTQGKNQVQRLGFTAAMRTILPDAAPARLSDQSA
jgi:hypothetical protein